MKAFIQKYKHIWVASYALIYMPWFMYLEKHVTTNYNVIQTSLDHKIPFIEFFIVPYYLWFLFIATTIVYFFFKDTKEFYKLVIFLIVGMTIFLIVSTLWPNGQNLRPKYFPRDNIFVDWVKHLYATDTPTNIFPSVHVYNSLGCLIAIRNSVHLKEKKGIQTLSLILTTLIILSTVFLKQHSFIDVVGAGVIAAITWFILYRNRVPDYSVSSAAGEVH